MASEFWQVKVDTRSQSHEPINKQPKDYRGDRLKRQKGSQASEIWESARQPSHGYLVKKGIHHGG
jgi:hypothetical protein